MWVSQVYMYDIYIYMCILYIHVYACIYMYIHVYTCIYMCTYMYIHIYIHVYTCIYMSIHVYSCVDIYIYIYTCVYMCIYIYIYMRIYVCDGALRERVRHCRACSSVCCLIYTFCYYLHNELVTSYPVTSLAQTP